MEASEVIAFVGSADPHQARAFYAQTLGLRVIEHNDFACVLDAHGTMLRVTGMNATEVRSPWYCLACRPGHEAAGRGRAWHRPAQSPDIMA